MKKQLKALAEELGLESLDFQLFLPEKTVSFQDVEWGSWLQTCLLYTSRCV